MYRALVAVITLFTVPAAFTQSIEVASCSDCKREPLEKKSPVRIVIRAKCSFPDGTVVTQQLIEVDAGASTQAKRAAAEQVCQPIMEAASARCDDLANRVGALKSEWRIAALYSARARELQSAIKQALASAPDYCK
jgi:hypothetical protein